ncbi:Pentatricopeptide repeat [Parasponia andersonii]|uniref:Pentatricopeptide repeat n=1 Tax=Parasponia andersonii TaxID=3476 RepID=A0A2P5AWH9_PARAD|nr:Pentatricopeptide repeat [Parasponia andersonii]
MYLMHLISGKTINNISRINGRLRLNHLYNCESAIAVSAPTSSSSSSFHSSTTRGLKPSQNPKSPKLFTSVSRYIHSTPWTKLSYSADDIKLDSDEDGAINEFLSRFVWIMRAKLSDSYPDLDKATLDGMLLVIVERVVSEMEKAGVEQMLGSAAEAPSQDFSEDLWKTVWEVSNMVLDDMKKAAKKEKMKGFLQSEEVKEMCRFAGEIGIRGDLLRELRFKWAREKMEESEFYQSLERLKAEDEAREVDEEAEGKQGDAMAEGAAVVAEEEEPKALSLPKRRGKIRYKIYGLDLSDPKWAAVADKAHEAGEVILPQEPKQISGRSKLVTEKILSLTEKDDPSPLLAEWVELLQPSRIDWTNLLDRLNEQNSRLYFKIAELVLSEKSFQTNIRDYSKLIDAHAKENHLEDTERILKKMSENGIVPDILTATVLVHVYSKAGNIDRAKEAFESLRVHGFQPDLKLYNSMIMAYVKAGQPKLGESLMREMEARDIKPTKEIYMALLQTYSEVPDVAGAARIATTMQFSGFQASFESSKLLIQAYGQAGYPDDARNNFDYLIKLFQMPDDECTASMLAAYEKSNLLDKALNLLMELEKDGFEPGVSTYTVLVDWLGKLQLIDEAEQLLGRISQQGEAPPLKIHVSLCDMYARAGVEKKALQALGVLEAKKEELGSHEFERIINGLMAGGFVQHAHRMHRLMEARGFAAAKELGVTMMASQTFGHNRLLRR